MLKNPTNPFWFEYPNKLLLDNVPPNTNGRRRKRRRRRITFYFVFGI
jgi:hypothetical protein